MTRDDFPPALVELAHMMGLTPFIAGGFDYDLADDARFLQRERVGLDDIEAVKAALGGEVAGYPEGYYAAVAEAARGCDPDLLEAYQSRRGGPRALAVPRLTELPPWPYRAHG